MGLNIFKVKFSNTSNQLFLRLDPKYRHFQDIKKGLVWKDGELIKLKEILKELKSKKFKKGELDDEYYLIDLENIESKLNLLENLQIVKEIGSDKTFIKNGDLVLPKLEPKKGQFFLNLEHKEYIGSTELIEFEINSEEYHPTFLYYLITNDNFLNSLGNLESGKAHKRIIISDLLNIRIPLIDKLEQEKAIQKISPIEQNIKKLKSKIKESIEIINKIFTKEFKYDERLWIEFGKGMTAGTQKSEDKKIRVFKTKFSEIQKSKILRFSTRYHNPPTKKLMNIINCFNNLQVKDILIEPIHRGKQPVPIQEGKIPAIKTGQLKNGNIDLQECDFVSEDFYNNSINAQTKKSDILLASTGKVSLGKIDIYESEDKAVVDGHVSIIRINKEKYIPLFFVYYFRSILGAFQIERDFTGTTNQIELSADEIYDIQIPDILPIKQQSIVNEIKKELDEQNKIRELIKQERDKIDKIIEEVIK